MPPGTNVGQSQHYPQYHDQPQQGMQFPNQYGSSPDHTVYQAAQEFERLSVSGQLSQRCFEPSYSQRTCQMPQFLPQSGQPVFTGYGQPPQTVPALPVQPAFLQPPQTVPAPPVHPAFLQPPQTVPAPPSQPDSEETLEVVCFAKRGIALQSSDQPFYVLGDKDYPLVTLEDVELARSCAKGYVRDGVRTVLGTDYDIGLRQNKSNVVFLQAVCSDQTSTLVTDSEDSTKSISKTAPTVPKQQEEKKASHFIRKKCNDCGEETSDYLDLSGRNFCPKCLLERLKSRRLSCIRRDKSGQDIGTEEMDWSSEQVGFAWARVRASLGEAAYPDHCPLPLNSIICEGKGHIVGLKSKCEEGGCPLHVLCKACANGKEGCPVCGAKITYMDVRVQEFDSRPNEA